MPSPAAAKPASGGALGIVNPISDPHCGGLNAGHARIRARWHPLDYMLGTIRGQFMCLVVVAVILNVVGAAVWRSTGGNDTYNDSWEHSFWFAWGMFFDPGTEMAFASEEPMNLKATAVCFSILGFSFNLLFLGLIVEIVRTMLEHFRRKRSRIIANGHTLILGWTQKTLFVIDAIFRSCGSLGARAHIVILADVEEFRMRQEFELHFPTNGMSNLIELRQGSPFECDELKRVSAYSANHIVILANEDAPRLADLETMRTVIALAAMPKPPMCPVTAEVRVNETQKVIRSMCEVADGVFARDAVRRIMCLCALHPSLGDVYKSLISWSKSAEIYLGSLEDLGVAPGSTVGEAQEAVKHGIIIGVRPEDTLSSLVPPETHILSATDKLLVLSGSAGEISNRSWDRLHRSMQKLFASTRTTRSFADEPVRDEFARSCPAKTHDPKMVVIIVGWPKDMDDVFLAIDGYISVGVGSRVIILSSVAEEDRKKDLDRNFAFPETMNFEIEHRVDNTTSIQALAKLPLAEATAVMVLADDSSEADRRLQDASTLQTVVTINGLLNNHHTGLFSLPPGADKPRVICEIMTAETERALRSDKDLRRAAKFFHTEMLETALFTIASRQRPVYNCLKMMLQTRKEYGDIVIVSASMYYKDDEMKNGSVTWKECFARVRKSDDVLIGVVASETSCKGLHWDFTTPGPTVSMSSQLFVITRRKEVLMPGESERMKAHLTATGVGTTSTPASRK